MYQKAETLITHLQGHGVHVAALQAVTALSLHNDLANGKREAQKETGLAAKAREKTMSKTLAEEDNLERHSAETGFLTRLRWYLKQLNS